MVLLRSHNICLFGRDLRKLFFEYAACPSVKDLVDILCPPDLGYLADKNYYVWSVRVCASVSAANFKIGNIFEPLDPEL